MSSALRLCPKCGASIPTDAPEGGCPGCLLEQGLSLPANGTPAANELGNKVQASPAPTVLSTEQPGRGAGHLGDLGDYELLEEVGRGAQGAVFRARQKSLDRIVALKVVSLGQWTSESHLKRFRREAEAVAKLDHPGIAPIYEVSEREGWCYFSMKFIEGGALDEVVRHTPISMRRAAELIAKVARTVHYAHEHGILHRDIKPGNILLDKEGKPHLTDFGLARLIEPGNAITRTQEFMGTPGYVAPEQASASGANLTSATDVYGLGAVLYQLLTGQPPFAAQTTYETIKLLLETDPRLPRQLNPKVDRDLSTICLKCLQKDPQHRYSSALALAEDLERWLKHEPIKAKNSGMVARGIKWVRRNPILTLLFAALIALAATAGWISWDRNSSNRPRATGIAVLPFENLSREPDGVYLADGVQDQILSRLTKIAELRVISRNSTAGYRSRPRNLEQIAKRLGVSNFLEGSVQRAGDQVRISVQLTNAHTNAHLWAETYDRKLIDVFLVETDIAEAIADSLKTRLTVAERKAITVRSPTTNPEAYGFYLKGRFFWNKRTGTDLRRAIDYFNRAVSKDSHYALAYSGLADCYDLLSEYSELSPKECYPKAAAAAKKALQLDAKLGEAHASLAYSLINYDWDRQGAEQEYQRSIELNPNYATAHQWHAECLMTLGRHVEAIGAAKRAEQLDPLSLIISQGVGGKYFYARRYDEAIAQFHKTLELYPEFPMTHQRLGRCYLQKGMLKEAIVAMQKAADLSGNSTQMLAALGYTYAAAGRRDAAQSIVAELERRSKERYVDSYFVAAIFAALGATDNAFASLDKAYAERSKWLSYLNIDFQLDNIRSDPRFDALAHRVFALSR